MQDLLDSEFDPLVRFEPVVEEVYARLARRVARAFRDHPAGDEDTVVRVAVPAPAVAPLDWLAAQTGAEKLYWSARSSADALAGLGSADAVQEMGAVALDVARRRLGRAEEARYFGGFRFDPRRMAEGAWTAFGASRLVLPRFEFERQGGQHRLVCSIFPRRDLPERVLGQVRSLRWPTGVSRDSLPFPIERADLPTQPGWEANIRWALEAFEEGGLEKIVLARRADFCFEESLDAVGLLRVLARSTPGCFHFLFQPGRGSAFVGATPERLYRRFGRHIESEAVAGTRPRGASAVDDARLRSELLASDKDQREHHVVVRAIADTLEPFCRVLEIEGEASEMRLARGRHLYTGFRGHLRPDVTDAQLLGALHPTPAVGGWPTPVAVEAIAALEPFDRGWYAGPVGWVGADAAEFAVGIRSGLVEGERLSLFSGAGIVRGSDPASEWEEIEQKIGDFINVMGLDLRSAT